MSEDLSKLSQSIVEIAKEVDGHVSNYGKSTPNEDTAVALAQCWHTSLNTSGACATKAPPLR